MTIRIQEKIFIEASKEEVWEVLTNFNNYQDWNPFMKSISGELTVNSKLFVDLGNMKFKPKILTIVHNKELVWIGELLLPGILDGKHQFIITEYKEGVFFEQIEEFSGVFTGLFKKSIQRDVKMNFSLMNMALKTRVEKK